MKGVSMGRAAAYGKHEAKQVARERLRGMVTAICLPVDREGEIDEAGLRHDVRYCLDVLRSKGLYVNGYYAHYWLLTSAQRRRVTEIVVDEVDGAVPIINRIASESPGEAIAYAEHAQAVGADFVSLIPPLFGGPEGVNKELLLRYFRMIADQVEIGISFFNTIRVGYTLPPQVIAEIAEIPNVAVLKNGMPVEHTREVLDLVGDGLLVTDPNEERWEAMIDVGQTLFFTGNNQMLDSPRAQPLYDIAEAAYDGRREDAHRIWQELEPVRAVHAKWVRGPWQATNLIPIATIKHWSSLLGMTGGPVPDPLPKLSDQQKDQLRSDLEGAGLLEPRAAAS
jgi:4-hydroxy-tetrahydrodipicolinate synthase